MPKEPTETQNRALELHRQIQEARRTRKLSQSWLAREVACKQSAISMYEGGHAHALASETVRKICGILDLEWPGEATDAPTAPQPSPQQLAYCPQAECPSNIPYQVAGELRFLPAQQHLSDAAPHCRYCGELLECNSPECCAPVAPGACCVSCGCAYVVGAPPAGTDLTTWLQAQRTLAIQVASFPQQ